MNRTDGIGRLHEVRQKVDAGQRGHIEFVVKLRQTVTGLRKTFADENRAAHVAWFGPTRAEQEEATRAKEAVAAAIRVKEAAEAARAKEAVAAATRVKEAAEAARVKEAVAAATRVKEAAEAARAKEAVAAAARVKKTAKVAPKKAATTTHPEKATKKPVKKALGR